MEALTGATIAALTIYDMVKAVSHRVEIGPTVLVSKSGGKSDFDRAQRSNYLIRAHYQRSQPTIS